MAFGHAASAWCAGLVITNVAGAAPATTLGVAAVSAVVAGCTVAGAMAGAALLPDLDHHGSTATTAFGGLSWWAHRGVVRLHNGVCLLTWDPGEQDPPAHRGVTHWWPFPVVLGAVVGVPCWFIPWASWFVLSILLTLAIRGLTVPEYRPADGRGVGTEWAHAAAGLVPTVWVMRRARRHMHRAGHLGVFAIGAALAAGSVWTVPTIGRWLGVIVALGVVVHIAGDAPTYSRVPGWTLRGELRLPKWLAFRAGGWFEVACLWVPFSVAGVLLIPGVWPLVMVGVGAVSAAMAR